MKLEMYPVVVDTTEAEDIAISVPGGTGSVRVTVEQVPFLIELLSKAKTQIEDDRYRRTNS